MIDRKERREEGNKKIHIIAEVAPRKKSNGVKRRMEGRRQAEGRKERRTEGGKEGERKEAR